MLSTRQIADELGTTPKILRQFLRQDDTFGGVGSGARYSLDKKDLPRLKKRFQEWAGDRALMKGKSYIKGEGEKGMSTSVLKKKKLTQAEKDEIKRKADARIDRLEAALRAKGLHISQRKATQSRSRVND